MMKIDQLIRDRKLKSQMTLQVRFTMSALDVVARGGKRKSFSQLVQREIGSMLLSSPSRLLLTWGNGPKMGAISVGVIRSNDLI